MSELVDVYGLDNRLHTAISRVENNELISQDFILKVLRNCHAYLSWTIVQDAMREARETQKMTQELWKEMN
jgi:hypothetical protein